jgi:hypothetical protein
MKQTPWNPYGHAYSRNDEQFFKSLRQGGAFSPKGLNPYMMGLMMWQRRQAGMQPPTTPGLFYKQLFGAVEPHMVQAIQNMLKYFVRGADYGALNQMTGALTEKTAMGATDFARILRAQLGSGAGSVARAARNYQFGNMQRQVAEMNQQAIEQGSNPMLRMAMLLMGVLQPEMLAQYNARKAAIDVQRSAMNAQRWQTIGNLAAQFGMMG